MRLTLRTMLAYMDDILEPADAQELGKKIEQSDFASALVHRIRSSMRRLRLGSPPVEGKGMGLDPNTVAEYLDSTLPQDRMPDFEKVCLESDVHLAEVAACHQVLALVLGEPAEVETALRQRMYQLTIPEAAEMPKRPETAVAPPAKPVQEGDGHSDTRLDEPSAVPAAPEAPPVSAAPPPAPPTVEAPPTRAEVPEYLRAQHGVRLLPLAIAMLAAFVLALAGLWAAGWFDRGDAITQVTPDARQQVPADASRKSVSEQPGENDLADDEAMESEQGAQPNAAQRRAKSDGGSRETAATSDDADSADTTQQQRSATAEADDADLPVARPDARTSGNPLRDGSAEQITEGPLAPLPDINAETLLPEGLGTSEGTTEASENTGTETGEGEGPATQETMGVGRFVSENQVLLEQDPDSGFWERLAPRTVLQPGQQLQVLPTYRPQILMSSGVQLVFSGASAVRLEEADAQGLARVVMPYGRALIVTVGKPEAQLHLNLAGHEGLLGFGDAESTGALEVRLWRPPGTNPEEVPSVPVIKIYATSGEILWMPAGQDQPLPIKAGELCAFLAGQPPQFMQVDQFPGWIDGDDVSSTEQLASVALEPALERDRPVTLSLQEMVNFRRYEVRRLAVRSLGYLDEFDPFIDALNDPLHKTAWDDHFETLQQALARGPETAAQVRMALEKHRGEDAQILYRLLWGYSPEQLTAGAAAQLVDYLDHPQMDVRVLAFVNLKRITDKTLAYYPERGAEDRDRKSAVRTWRQRLQAGEVVYERPPSPLP